MPTNDKTGETVVLLVQVEKEYDQYRVKGRVHRHQLDGEMESANWNYGNGLACDYDGFAVHAYLGNPWSTGPTVESEQGVWGHSYSYSPHRIESAQQAKAIAKVMTRLESGLDRLNHDEGYLASGDLAGYLLRITRVLRIKEIWTRTTPRRFDMTGETYRKVNGSDLQYWVQEVDQSARAGKQAELIRR